MRSSTELLAELIAIYDAPEKGAAELYLWVHQQQGEVRGAIEGEADVSSEEARG